MKASELVVVQNAHRQPEEGRAYPQGWQYDPTKVFGWNGVTYYLRLQDDMDKAKEAMAKEIK